MCNHSHVTFPQMAKPGVQGIARRGLYRVAGTPGPYITCLDCGREFQYDWARMKRGPERELVPTKPWRLFQLATYAFVYGLLIGVYRIVFAGSPDVRGDRRLRAIHRLMLRLTR